MLHIVLAGIRRYFAIVLIVVWGHGHAAEYTVHIGPNGYAPYSIIERNGTDIVVSGIIFEILDAFEASHPNYYRKNELLTRKRANAKMANGEDIDVMFNSRIFVSEEILEHYEFTVPLFTTKDVVITHKSNHFEYKNATDLFGKNVGTIRGYSYGKFDRYIQSGKINDFRVDRHTQAIGMLVKNRVDAYFGNIFVSPHYIKQLGLHLDDFVFSEVPMYEFDFSFAVNKQKPDLYHKLNKFITASIADGTLDRLVKKYIE